MMRFTDISEFHKSYQFFMLKPSPGTGTFIITVTCAIIAAIIWACNMKMDDVVKTTALLRPAQTISTIKAISGGELLQKNYAHDGYVYEGDILLQLDISADALEFDNSKKLMNRLEDNILIYNTLLETIRQGRNSAGLKNTHNEEAFIRAETYLIEYRRQESQIEEMRIKLEWECALPGTLAVKDRLDDMVRELELAELQVASWKNNQMLGTLDFLKSLLQMYPTIRSSLQRNNMNYRLSIKDTDLYNGGSRHLPCLTV